MVAAQSAAKHFIAAQAYKEDTENSIQMRDTARLVLGEEGRSTKRRGLAKIEKVITGVDTDADTTSNFVELNARHAALKWIQGALRCPVRVRTGPLCEHGPAVRWLDTRLDHACREGGLVYGSRCHFRLSCRFVFAVGRRSGVPIVVLDSPVRGAAGSVENRVSGTFFQVQQSHGYLFNYRVSFCDARVHDRLVGPDPSDLVVACGRQLPSRRGA
jgi:hypothetical protein